jgi:hypothetical protein
VINTVMLLYVIMTANVTRQSHTLKVMWGWGIMRLPRERQIMIRNKSEISLCLIYGSYGDDYKVCFLLGSDAVKSGRCLTTFRRKVVRRIFIVRVCILLRVYQITRQNLRCRSLSKN